MRAATCELPPHRVALLIKTDVAMTVISTFAIHVIVDHAKSNASSDNASTGMLMICPAVT